MDGFTRDSMKLSKKLFSLNFNINYIYSFMNNTKDNMETSLLVNKKNIVINQGSPGQYDIL